MVPERFPSAFAKLERRPTSVTVADLDAPDFPLIFANSTFLRLTGYSLDEILGRNCRFLQGHGTDSNAAKAIGTAVSERRDTAVTIRNYRKDGTPFDNLVMLLPIGGPKVTRFVLGCQYVLRPNARTGQGEVRQGVVSPRTLGSSRIDPIIWDSVLARSQAIRLILEAHTISLEPGATAVSA